LANHKQAEKRTRQNIKRAERNRPIRTKLRTSIKKVRADISGKKADEAKDSLKAAVKQLDKSVTKGILHRRTASRLISRLTVAVSKLQ
jgi:small subunit ribosomal protein S20